MSSTEIVHGHNNSTTPQPGFSGGNDDHSASYAVQAQEQPAPAAVSATTVFAAATTDPSAPVLDDKRFTTSYGMVVWPTLPGLSSSSSPSSTPVPAPGTQMSSTPADLVHHHSPSEATAAPRTAQTLLPGTMATITNHANCVSGGGGPLQYSTSSTMLLRAACDACHRMKRKCDGKHPCARCERRGRDCLYSYKQKSGPPKGSKRKLIEEEDDLPENRPGKPTLRYHMGEVTSNAGGGGSFPPTTVATVEPTAAPAMAAPAVATWPGSNRSNSSNRNKGSNLIENGGSGNGGDVRGGGGEYGNLHVSSSSTSIETIRQLSQAPARQFVQMSAQQPMPPHAQQCNPSPSTAPSPPSPLRPSPEARAAAAAAVAASRMNALAPVAPTLATAGLHPQFMLQSPPVTLPGLTGGGGGVAVGQGPASSLATHPYGTVYHHQYPPEVYAVYLAELRQRSSGSSNNISSSNNSRSSNNNNSGGGGINDIATSGSSSKTTTLPPKNNNIAPAATLATPTAAITPLPPVLGSEKEMSSLATVAAVQAAQIPPPATDAGLHASAATSDGSPASTTRPNAATGWSMPLVAAIPAGHLLPGIGGDSIGTKGSVGTSGGSSGGGGGGDVEQDVATLAHEAKMPDRGDGGGDSYYAGKAAAAAASSAALAAAVAAAIARSSPVVEGESSKTVDALTCSMAPSDGGCGNSDIPNPLSPVRSNQFSVAAPEGGGGDGRTGESSPKMVLEQTAAVADVLAPAPASASIQREKNELAAAGLLLYGARGQGGTVTGAGRTGAADVEKEEEGQENNLMQEQQQQQQQPNDSLAT